MADFEKSYLKLEKNEGGYVNDKTDRGGETYKGVARNFHADWEGWVIIDLKKQQTSFPKNLKNDSELESAVKDFYRVKFWHRVQGDKIESEKIAESIFDFAVNAGVKISSILAQIVVGAASDGVIGKKTVAKINEAQEELFLAEFSLAKIARYVHICEKNKSQRKYFFGWVTRTLRGLR